MNRRPTSMLALAALTALACASGGGPASVRGGSASGPGPETTEPAAPERPAACTRVAPGSLPAALAAAPEGSALCLQDGRYPGPVVIDRRLTVWGTRRAVIHSSGEGTTVRIAAHGTQLLGVTVDGSGGRYDQQDAAVAVRADDVIVAGVRVIDAVFGILADRSNRVHLLRNDVTGRAEDAMSLRGDGIRLWEVRGSVVDGNRLRASRDLVVWYSPGNRITRNVVTDSRYGTHFMHSHDNVVTGNRYERNAVGVFAMYSRGIEVRDNLFLDALGAVGMCIGIKDSGNVDVVDNTFVRCSTAIYLDNSPVAVNERNRIERNGFRLGRAALVFHGPTRGNEIRANDFAGNADHVVVEGGGDALAAHWEGNHWDDYAGYDLDDDGAGDVPYELRSLSNELAGTRPQTRYFRGTAAFGVVDALGKLVPLFAPRTLMRDEHPAMSDPRATEDSP